jgi:hypothetical protein
MGKRLMTPRPHGGANARPRAHPLDERSALACPYVLGPPERTMKVLLRTPAATAQISRLHCGARSFLFLCTDRCRQGAWAKEW